MLAALAGPAAAEARYDSAGQVADAAAKRKAKKCRKGQVKVKLGKRILCRPLRKVMPKPRAGDPRKLFTSFVMKKDLSNFRNRRGKRGQSLPKLIRKVGPGAPALLANATARGFRRLDAMASSGAAARMRAAPHARAAGDCANLQNGQPLKDSFKTGGGGGPTATVGVSMGADGAEMGIELTGDEYSVKADIDMGLCDPNEVEAPSCPTAVGKLDGQIRYKFKVAILVTRGGTDIWSTGAETVRKTKLTGWNAVDAKLDTLDVDDVETSTLSAGGESRAHPPISIRTRINRTTSVDMRSGAYNAGDSRLDVRIGMEGLYGPDRDEAETDAERRAQADADKQWRAVIKKAIDGYRSREEGWQTANTCAGLKFTAAANTITLHGGDSGNLRATVTAKSDGQPSELDARLTDIENAIFRPTRAGGTSSANFTYENVASATTAGAKVRTKVHATSKAGVAEDTWEQPIAPPFKINQIAGNFSGSYTQGFSGGRQAHVTWTAAGTFVRNPADFPGALGNYTLMAGQASYHFSGQEITGSAACQMSGDAFVDLYQKGSGAIGVQPLDMQKPFEQGPHGYSGGVNLGPDAKVTITKENCEPGAESEEGKQYEYPIGIPPLETGDNQASADGIHYEGSHTRDDGGGISYEWTWVLEGSLKNP